MESDIQLGNMTLCVEDFYRHLMVLGNTGSGKTRYVFLPLLTQLLSLNSGDPGKRAGALVFDVKGDMEEHVRTVMKAAGRTDELIILGRGGNAWFDPFEGLEGDSRAVAERLMEIVGSSHRQGSRGDNDDFWRENNRRLFQVAAVVSRVIHLGDLCGVRGIARGVEEIMRVREFDPNEDDDNPPLIAQIESAERAGIISSEDSRMAAVYLQTEAKGLSHNTWSIIINYAQAYVSCLRDSRLSSLFDAAERRPIPFRADQVIDEGRVVLVSLSRVHFGPAAEVYRNLVKTAFQQSALQRFSRFFFDGRTTRPVNAERPAFFVADEFPSFVTPGSSDDGDAFFLDKCREAKVGCLLAAQGISALASRFTSHSRVLSILNNCSTKIFLSTDCPETLCYFASSVPDQNDDYRRDSSPAMRTPPNFRLPNYTFREAPVPIGQNGSGKPKIPPSILRELTTGEGVVLRPAGFAEKMTFPRFLGES